MLCPTFQYFYLLIQLSCTSDRKERSRATLFINLVPNLYNQTFVQNINQEIYNFKKQFRNQISKNDDSRFEEVIELLIGLKKKIDVYINLHPVLKNDVLVKQFYWHLIYETMTSISYFSQLHNFSKKSFDDQENSFDDGSSSKDLKLKILSKVDIFKYRVLPLLYSIIDSIFSYFFAIYTYEQTEINMKSHVEILENAYPKEFENISHETYKGVLKIFFENASQDLKMKVKEIYGKSLKEGSLYTSIESINMFLFHIESFEQNVQNREKMKHIYNCRKILTLTYISKYQLFLLNPIFYDNVSGWVFNIFLRNCGKFASLLNHRSSRKLCPLCYLSLYIPESEFKQSIDACFSN
ncbi:hypothetical protein M153_12700015330 [Pseudoloma neurophilia]|uniref:Uncharacterized protein n=1 Tax=Pseudoloma neurophilia TaxID=146866 RepID=A0A0R0M0B9_9MICR|nr:hypothetical protein M153_12700015330 [Pseudoloma neurophilia]